MASLKNIKLKIQSVKKTSTVTHAMEAVSAVKMRKSQERALAGRMYAATALSILERVSGTTGIARHPLMQGHEGKACFLIITSDKGLAGALNSAVIRKVEREITARGLSKDNVIIAAIGKRGGEYFASRGYQLLHKGENARDDVSEEEMRAVTAMVMASFNSGDMGFCFVTYQNFISTFEQEPVVRQILPITPQMVRDMVAGIRPARGRYSPKTDDVIVRGPVAYTIEPDADSVLSFLLPKLFNIAVFHALLESKASEHSARMVAMKSATDKAMEMSRMLTRTFNKVRQASITREVSEITSGIEAMK